MPFLTSKTRLLTLALATAGVLGVAASANAVTYKGKWDPKYGDGVGLDGLGWNGEAEFKIEDSCLNSLGTSFSGLVTNFTSGCLGKLSIVSAKVNLFDYVVGQPGNNGPASDVTLSYGSAASPGTNGNNIPTKALLSMYVDQGNIKAVNGGFWLPEVTTKFAAPFAVAAGYNAAAYWLGFSGDQNNLTNVPNSAQARLASCSFNRVFSFDFQCSANDSRSPDTQAIMTITPVPEPEAYLMGLISLAVIGVWSRRRRPVVTSAAAAA